MSRVSKAVMIGDIEGYNDGRVLLLRRAPAIITERSPWEWDLPGGHIQEGETDKQALAREVKEETGISLLHVPNWFFLAKDTRFFIVQDWEGKFELSNEHTDFECVDPEELKSYDLGEMYTKAVEQAFNW